MRKVKAAAAACAFVVALFGGIVVLQNKLSSMGKTWTVPPSMAYLPESEKIRPLFLGFHTAFADFLWIKTTIYFGGHFLSDKQYPWLLQMIDIVTRLNPAFYPAYEFGGLMVPEVCRNPHAARIILERGVCAPIGKKWKLYFYLGMLYYKYYGDYEKAAICLATAAQLPGAPVERLMSVVVNFTKRYSGTALSDQLQTLMYASSENPEVRRYLMNKAKESSAVGGRHSGH
jgi:hypothetical protein